VFALCVPFNFKGSTVTTTWLSEETTSRHEGQLRIGLHYDTILTVLPTCLPDGTVHFHWLYQDHTNIRNNSVRQETFFPVFTNLGFVKTSKAVVRSKVTIKFLYVFNSRFSFYFLIILFLNNPEFLCIWEGLQTLPSGLTFTHKITVLLNFSYNSAEFHISFILLPYRFAIELFIWRMSAFCVPFNIWFC
jgi:hypothetical protein